MESLIYVLFGFLVCMCICSILNILLKTTQKRDWLINYHVLSKLMNKPNKF